MEDAIAGGILKALMFLCFGAVFASAAYFVIGFLWISFGPNPEEDRMPEKYRKNYKKFNMKSYMGMD